MTYPNILSENINYTSSILLLLNNVAEMTIKECEQHFGLIKGCRISKLSKNLKKEVPDVLKRLVSVTHALSQTISEMHEVIPISPEIVQTLEKCKTLLRELSTKLNRQALCYFYPNHAHQSSDPYLVPVTLQKGQRIPHTHYEWSLNLALLMNVYVRTEDLELKREISFLALNYLAKVAPYSFDELQLPERVQNKLNAQVHHGLIEPGIVYNRECSIFERYLPKALSTELGKDCVQYFLIGSKDIADLLSVFFSVIQSDNKKENPENDWSDEMVRIIDPLLDHCVQTDFQDYMEPAILLDLTSYMDETPSTIDTIEQNVDRAITAAVKKLKQRHQSLQNPEQEERFILYLRSNITCIYRGKMGVDYVKILPIFRIPYFISPLNGSILKEEETKKKEKESIARSLMQSKFDRARARMTDFINATGIRMGSIQGRRKLLQLRPLEELITQNDQSVVSYSGLVGNPTLYKDPLSITKTEAYKRFADKLKNRHGVPYLATLGKSTLDLVEGLLGEIGKHTLWETYNSDSNWRQIVQTSLYRLQLHITRAANCIDQFGPFTQSVELIHCEMATLLQLFQPFKKEDYPVIFKQNLRMVPPELHSFVKGGVAKSSMNTLAAIKVALRKINSESRFVYQKLAHFEITQSMRLDYALEEALQQPLKEVHLYVADFNHNIYLKFEHNEYKKSDLISEIEALLKITQEKTPLTVVVDCTINLLQSSNVYSLLDHFSSKIKTGKLHFVFIESGQKFVILGQDNYYGGPYFMVGKGDGYETTFEEVLAEELYQTDLLSTQWFCLLNKYAPHASDNYKKEIFKNTRRILDAVPNSLKPGSHPFIKVCTVAAECDSCFIDIKINENQENSLAEELKQLLYKKFADHHAVIHTRGGYGFYHPNFTSLDLPRSDMEGNSLCSNLRINPGLDEKETDLIIEFLEDVAAKYPNNNQK